MDVVVHPPLHHTGDITQIAPPHPNHAFEQYRRDVKRPHPEAVGLLWVETDAQVWIPLKPNATRTEKKKKPKK